MADTKISALTATSPALTTHRIPIAISPFGAGDNGYLTGAEFYRAFSGVTLTGANTITQAGFNTTYSGIGKVTFSPTTGASSVAGLNIGSIAGNPTSFADGDFWYNSSANNYTGRVASATVAFMWFNTGAGDLVTTRVPYISATSGRFTSSSNFTFASSRLTTWLTLAAGTATAATSPLKFTSGTNLTTAEAGAMEVF